MKFDTIDVSRQLTVTTRALRNGNVMGKLAAGLRHSGYLSAYLFSVTDSSDMIGRVYVVKMQLPVTDMPARWNVASHQPELEF